MFGRNTSLSNIERRAEHLSKRRVRRWHHLGHKRLDLAHKEYRIAASSLLNGGHENTSIGKREKKKPTIIVSQINTYSSRQGKKRGQEVRGSSWGIHLFERNFGVANKGRSGDKGSCQGGPRQSDGDRRRGRRGGLECLVYHGNSGIKKLPRIQGLGFIAGKWGGKGPSRNGGGSKPGK